MRQNNYDNHCCNTCDYNTSNTYDFSKHLLTRKHKINNKLDTNSINSTKKTPEKIASEFSCEICNYTTRKNSEYNRHIITRKHLNTVDSNTNNAIITIHSCNVCNKQFNRYNTLWKHKQKCLIDAGNSNQNISENEREPIEMNISSNTTSSDVIMEFIKNSKDIQNFLLEQNKELQKTLLELTKNQTVTNNTTNHTTNQQFNLQFFLNETCKDAMNITDFINSLQLTTEDFENTGKVGFIEGISQIIINKLNSVDTPKRPIHCMDAKRETVYIKNDNVWEKEDDKKTKFRKVVNQVANKNLQQIVKWKEEHPDCANLDTPDNINFRNYYKAAIGGKTHEEDDKIFEKIKRNVLREIVVDKNT